MEQIFWISFTWVEWSTFVRVESFGEFITVDDSEDSLVNIEVDSNVQVLPGVVSGVVLWERYLMSLQEDSLGNTRVLNLWLEDVDGVIVEEVVDSALSGSEVFVWIFDNWLDEKGIEDKDLFNKKY